MRLLVRLSVLFTHLFFCPNTVAGTQSSSSAAKSAERSSGGGGFVVTKPPEVAAASPEYDLDDFIYYGPRKLSVSGPAEVRDGEALCNPDESVRGKIVIMGDWCDSLSVSMDKMYENYNKFGARGLVYVIHYPLYPPGTCTCFDAQ